MTSEQQVIAAARAVRETYLEAVESRDNDIDRFADAFGRYREALEKLISELATLDREQQIPNISCSECMNLSFDTHHWDYARKHGHHPMCSTQQQSDVCECGHKQWCHPNTFLGCTYPGCGCQRFTQQKGQP